MIGTDCLFVLAAVFQVIASQGLPPGPPQGFPEKCRSPPPVENPQDCCPVTPIFSEEDLAECGFEKIDPKNRGRPFKPGPYDCSRQECLFEKKKLLKDDKTADKDAVIAYMDEWVKSNEAFKDVIEKAKAICVGENGPPGPPQVCEADRLLFCIGKTAFSECPVWQDTAECKILKEYMDECPPPRPPPN